MFWAQTIAERDIKVSDAVRASEVPVMRPNTYILLSITNDTRKDFLKAKSTREPSQTYSYRYNHGARRFIPMIYFALSVPASLISNDRVSKVMVVVCEL